MSKQIAVFGSWRKLMGKDLTYKNKTYQYVVTSGFFKFKGYDFFNKHGKDFVDNIIIIDTPEHEIEKLPKNIEKVYFYDKKSKLDTIHDISLPNMKLYDDYVDVSKYD